MAQTVGDGAREGEQDKGQNDNGGDIHLVAVLDFGIGLKTR